MPGLAHGCAAPICTTYSGRTTDPALLAVHDLAYLQHLIAALRDTIDAGRLADAAAAVAGRGPMGPRVERSRWATASVQAFEGAGWSGGRGP